LALALAVGGAEAPSEFQINLDRLWDFCVRDAGRCADVAADYVARTAATVKEVGAPIDISTLRVVVRSAAYVASLRREMSAAGRGEEPVAGYVAGDLWWVLVADARQSARVVSVREVQQQNLGPRAAMEIGRANLGVLLAPLSSKVRPLPANGVGTIKGDYYESSRLLLDDDSWAQLAAAMKGRLLIAVPDPGVVLYADAKIPKSRAALVRLAREVAATSERPLSTAVLQWSPDGWKAAR
jgi:hypothetical protein